MKYSNYLLVAALFLVLPASARASDLTLMPPSGPYTVGKPFSVQVLVTNNTQAINAVSGDISFPPDILTLTSISQAGSIVTLWPNQPTYSNATGQAHFEGAILNPGYSGSQGKIITLIFMPRRSGKADLLFTSGSVLANDGMGTSVLGSLGTGSYTVTGSAAPAAATAPKTALPVVLPSMPTTTETVAPMATSAPILSITKPVSPLGWLSLALKAFGLLALLLLALALLAALAVFLWYRVALLQRRMKRFLMSTERDIHRSFALLQEDLEEQFEALRQVRTQRKLTEEEKAVLETLGKHVKAVEEKLSNKIELAEEKL